MSRIFLLLAKWLCLWVPHCDAWLVALPWHRSLFVLSRRHRRRRSTTSLYVQESSSDSGIPADEENDGDDADDETESESTTNLEDWRKFRASLIAKEAQATDDGTSISGSTTGTNDDKKSTKATSKTVAPQNQALLATQNKRLAEEYETSVWAHCIAQPEIGGLLVRMPLEAELYYGGRQSSSKDKDHWSKKLQLMMQLEEAPNQKDGDNVEHWFRLAERIISKELQNISNSGLIQNGILNPSDLDENQRVLMDKYMRYKRDWQYVCLLLSHSPETGHSEAVVLNRPLSRFVNKNLATLLTGSGPAKMEQEPSLLDGLVQAFGREAAVYMGGPHASDEPALLVHGIADLEGCVQVAPGVYTGGLSAAIDGVLAGIYQPLDFRFFVGRMQYSPQHGALSTLVEDGAYQCLACARSLALKQCLGLPKPLFHEVLELCGGDLGAISRIELRKRIDLK